jgi:hypothetical protein
MKRVTFAVILVALFVPAAASARSYLVPPHARDELGTPVYQPRSVDVGPRYGDDAYVQETTWSNWGSSTAYGHGVIRDTMGMGAVIAHVTLTASDAKPFPQCEPPDDPPGSQTPGLLYRQLHAKFHWRPNPSSPEGRSSARAERQESKALSGNLAGAYELQC